MAETRKGGKVRPVGVLAGIVTAALAGFALPVAAQTPPANGNGSTAAKAASGPVIFGSLRVREEIWNWFEPTGNFDNDYAFTGAILRVGVSQKFSKGEGKVELAAPALLGLPTNAVAPAPQGALGLGGNYYAVNGDRKASLFVKQLFYQFPVATGQTLKVGRQEFNEGVETLPGDAAFSLLKRDRVSQRLIGTFAWTHVGRSFDSVQYVNNRPTLNVTAIGGFPTRGVFDLNGWNSLTDVRFAYVGATMPRYKSATMTDSRLFAIYYNDDRNINKTDNATIKDREPIKLGMIGGHLLASGKARAGKWDGLLWATYQFGDWGKLDHSALAYVAEAGYRFSADPKSPWLRAGYTHADGDSDPTDGKHTTFYAPLSTPRIYARTPFYTESNINDAFVQILYKPSPTVLLRSDYHRLALPSGKDLWYSGDGPFQSGPAFGLVGRKGNGSTSLADLIDLSADWTATKNDTFTLYLARMVGKSVVRGIYPNGANGSFIYLEYLRRF
jgi:hypothetical protein